MMVATAEAYFRWVIGPVAGETGEIVSIRYSSAYISSMDLETDGPYFTKSSGLLPTSSFS
jgi:hypothetical protein